MKGYTKSVLMSSVFVIFFGCDNRIEPIDQPVPALTSIVEAFNIDNAPESSITTYTINDNLNTQIELQGASYQIQSFEGDKMVSIEYYSNEGNLNGTTELTYDANNRLISRLSSFPFQNYMISETYSYSNAQVFATRVQTESDGSAVSESNHIFYLDSQNRIIRCENSNGQSSWEAGYSNGNLSSFKTFTDNVLKGEAVFTYSQKLATEPYQKESYRYGPEWRNNIMLSQTGEYAFKQLAELGTNLLTGYTYTLVSNPSNTISLTITYAFDMDNKLIQQTKNKVFFFSEQQRILNYIYDY